MIAGNILFLGEIIGLKLAFALELLYGCPLGKSFLSSPARASGHQQDVHSLTLLHHRGSLDSRDQDI